MLFPQFLLDDLLHDGLPTDSKTKVEKTEKGYSLELALPGVEEKDLSVDLDPTKNLILIEVIESSSFVAANRRVFEIPQSVDLDLIETTLERGVLRIELPRKSDAALKKLL